MYLFWVCLISAVAISCVSGFFSIVGLSAIFAGSRIPILIMGSVLEVGKLVTAVWLHHNWKNKIGVLKAYLFVAAIVLVFVTSIGVFGFLSKAHLQQQAAVDTSDVKIDELQAQINKDKSQLDRNSRDYQQLDLQVEQYINKGYLKRSIDVRNEQKDERKALTDERNTLVSDLSDLQLKLASVTGEKKKQEVEFGPIKYVAQLIYGDQATEKFDSAVRLLILILVFVFDPLAVCLLVASQISFKQQREYNEKQRDEKNNISEHSSPMEPIFANEQHGYKGQDHAETKSGLTGASTFEAVQQQPKAQEAETESGSTRKLPDSEVREEAQSTESRARGPNPNHYNVGSKGY